jgi:hypothetical protein
MQQPLLGEGWEAAIDSRDSRKGAKGGAVLPETEKRQVPEKTAVCSGQGLPEGVGDGPCFRGCGNEYLLYPVIRRRVTARWNDPLYEHDGSTTGIVLTIEKAKYRAEGAAFDAPLSVIVGIRSPYIGNYENGIPPE